jgi:hypothetical protein
MFVYVYGRAYHNNRSFSINGDKSVLPYYNDFGNYCESMYVYF